MKANLQHKPMTGAVLSTMMLSLLIQLLALSPVAEAFAAPSSLFAHSLIFRKSTSSSATASASRVTSSTLAATTNDNNNDESSSSSSPEEIFEQFAQFLITHQSSMIAEIENADGSSDAAFSKDGWGAFENEDSDKSKSGGITRVIQGGDVVEKGACSLTVIRNGVLTADRAATIQGRQDINKQSAVEGEGDDTDEFVVREGDVYSAAALSVVLHTKNPFVPTFRSDVRIFLVKSSEEDGKSVAWFGGGSDLTPYYLVDQDVIDFHAHLKKMCDVHFPGENNEYNLSYREMKKSCDEYFYLPARSEHRGTGGIFFDDLPATPTTAAFLKDVAQGWMPSWLPIVTKNGSRPYTEEEKHWQCLRRGRYLEFNLLYDRGVKFGLANANPRVEGVMVSAPPKIAFDYNFVPEVGSEEERLVEVLKSPKDWV